MNFVFRGGYIWGTGQLGDFAFKQCIQNQIGIKGFIDNNDRKWNEAQKIYPPDRLTEGDCVIIASIYYVSISRQLESLGIKKYIYYEELAYMQDSMSTYYQAFEGLFDEIEENKDKYMKLYDTLQDEISKKVYAEVMSYRMSLDMIHIVNAYEISKKEGCQYLDRIILSKLNKNFTFYDVGGFDGETTLDYIQYVKEYKKIYFFEPTEVSIRAAKKRLNEYENIEFIQAGAGADRGEAYINDAGGGGNFISATDAEGAEAIYMIKLDDYIDSSNSYVKLDVEGYETAALWGMKNAVVKFKPLLAISVYHIPGDIHKLTDLLLEWNPDYKIYMRHYTESYADTVCYFLNES